jgi:hypothetical protein
MRLVRQVDRERAIRIVAQELWEGAMMQRQAVDDALAQVGGRVTADLVRCGREWILAGEWEDVPKHLIRRPIVTARHEATDAKFVSGNCDEVADMARMSEDDLRDFLRSHTRKPKVADFLDAAAAWYDARTMRQPGTSGADRQAAYRARKRAEGRCIVCCVADVPAGRTTCHACGERANAAKRAKKAQAA